MKYNPCKHLYKIAVGFDQWACAIADGNIDSTISATCGKYMNKDKFFYFLARIVDWTFKPVDGPNHCLQAYAKDPNEDFKKGFKPLMFLFTITGCLVIAPITYTILLIKKLFR